MSHGTLRYADGGWYIEASPWVVMKLKRVFPRIDPGGHGVLHLSDTAEVARDIEWFRMRYALDCVGDGTFERLQAQAERHREQQTIVEQLLGGHRQPRKFDLALPMRSYQAVALEMLLASGGLLVGDDVGLGKTIIGIGLATQPEAQPSLVVTLTHLTRQWESEFKKFAPGIHTHILKKGTPYDLRHSRRAPKGQMLLGGDASAYPDVIITNYHKLAGWADALPSIVRSVTFDEIAELRHGKTSPGTKIPQKCAAAHHIAESCRYRLGLSATPIFGLGSEIHSVIHPLRPDALGSRGEFLEEWCGATDCRGNAALEDPTAFGTYLRDAGLMLRRTRDEVGRELPPLTQSIIHVEANESALDKIEQPAEELARIILGETELARGDKFRSSGQLEGLVRQATGLAKAPAVAVFARMILESGEPLLIYGWHHAVYEVLASRLREFNPVLFTGQESESQKARAKRSFLSGESRVLLMSLRAGQGLDGLQEVCRTCLFAELDWSPAIHWQGAGRLARDGQKHPVLAYFAITDCGSDPIIAEVLGIKKIQSQGIVDPKGEILESVDASGEHGKLLAQLYLKRSAAE